MTTKEIDLLRAFFAAKFMGIAETMTDYESGCGTCGHGADSLTGLTLEGVNKIFDDFIKEHKIKHES